MSYLDEKSSLQCRGQVFVAGEQGELLRGAEVPPQHAGLFQLLHLLPEPTEKYVKNLQRNQTGFGDDKNSLGSISVELPGGIVKKCKLFLNALHPNDKEIKYSLFNRQSNVEKKELYREN